MIKALLSNLLGQTSLKLSRKKKAGDDTLKDINSDAFFQSLYNKIKAFTLVGTERSFALYNATRHIIQHKIQGDFVECGVWKGGSAMLMAHTLLQAGQTNRKIWLYDTFEGMARPGAMDGESEKEEWEKMKTGDDSSNWCYSPIEEVRQNMIQTGYPGENIELVKGKVEETIPSRIPSQISMLRLDTDWYDSTSHELIHLYPLLNKGGILIIDDYGAWQGARKATDEYFAGKPVFMNRIDWTGRLIVNL